jgi:hypothetical protein
MSQGSRCRLVQLNLRVLEILTLKFPLVTSNNHLSLLIFSFANWSLGTKPVSRVTRRVFMDRIAFTVVNNGSMQSLPLPTFYISIVQNGKVLGEFSCD